MTLRKDRFRLSYPHKAFTLVELLVVVAVLALLASIVFSNLTGAREQAKISNALSFQSNMHNLLGADLVGWWNFDEGSGSVANDLSGYGNNGTIVGATRVDGVPGTGGKAMSFNGSSDYMELSNSLSIFNQSFTISMWIYHEGPKRGILVGDYNLPGSIDVNFEIYGDNRLRFYWSGTPNIFGPKEVNPQEWNFIVFIRDKENSKVYSYINQDIDIDYFGAISDKVAIIGHRIGRDSRSGETAFNGLIDDVRIYSRALTAYEVQTLYAQTKDNYLAEEQ